MSDTTLNEHPLVKPALKTLLQDKTTKNNIIFATDDYLGFGDEYGAEMNMTEELLLQISQEIQPRVAKSLEAQKIRTKEKAEVMTPPWVVCMMNGHCDADWFGRENVFERLDGQQWNPTSETVQFPETKKHSWRDYVDCRRMEITCGEAPFIVSRYDTTTGEPIPIERRVGFLDHKLRVVNENTQTEEEWFKWTVRAFQSCYGFEFQGDNLLIARINLLLTFTEYLEARWNRLPRRNELQRISTIIAWNLWQMDAFTGTIPYGELEKEKDPWEQMSLFELQSQEELKTTPPCLIRDWRATGVGGRAMTYISLKGEKEMRKFSVSMIIGNPPYQEENQNNGRQNPIYHLFMEEAYQIGDCVELITPARFLFDAGQTPKDWNKKMLSDSHLKVLYYNPDPKGVFNNTEIKGGVAVTLYDKRKDYGAIRVFTKYPELNQILNSVFGKYNGPCLDSIISPRGSYRTTELFFETYPFAADRLGKGTGNMIASNFFEKLPEVWVENPAHKNDYYGMLCRVNNQRKYCYLRRKYVQENPFIHGYNVASPKSNGSGLFGEVLTATEIIAPQCGAADTFISIGTFDTLQEAENLAKYIKTKFLRAMLGVKKVTQDNSRAMWNMIPLQNFTSASDINWNTSIANIDRQLYKKYGLSPEEIAFIESHVKEME